MQLVYEVSLAGFVFLQKEGSCLLSACKAFLSSFQDDDSIIILNYWEPLSCCSESYIKHHPMAQEHACSAVSLPSCSQTRRHVRVLHIMGTAYAQRHPHKLRAGDGVIDTILPRD